MDNLSFAYSIIEKVLEPLLDALLDDAQEREVVESLRVMRSKLNEFSGRIDYVLEKLTDDHNLGA